MRHNRTSLINNSNISQKINTNIENDIVNKQKIKRNKKMTNFRNSLNEEEIKKFQEE